MSPKPTAQNAHLSLESLLAPYAVIDHLVVTRKPATIVTDPEIKAVLLKRQKGEGARILMASDILAGKRFTPQPGPYFVVTQRDEQLVKLRLRRLLERWGAPAEIYGALHDLLPMLAAESHSLNKSGMERSYETLRFCKAYAVTCTPRSGSQFLIRELQRHSLGHPLEHIRPPVLNMMRAKGGAKRLGGFDFTHWFASLMQHGARSSVFGTKLISHFIKNFDALASPVERSVFDAFLARIPLIYLLRTNKLLQALSRDREKATTHDQFFDETKRPIYEEQNQNWQYDFDRICREIQALVKEEQYLLQRMSQSVPAHQRMLVEYETMQIPGILTFLETQIKTQVRETAQDLATNVLWDSRTRTFAERFQADYAKLYREEDPLTHVPHQVHVDDTTFEMFQRVHPDAIVLPKLTPVLAQRAPKPPHLPKWRPVR